MFVPSSTVRKRLLAVACLCSVPLYSVATGVAGSSPVQCNFAWDGFHVQAVQEPDGWWGE